MKNRKIHTTAGDAVGAQKLPNGLRILTDRAFLDVVIYSSDVLRFISCAC